MWFNLVVIFQTSVNSWQEILHMPCSSWHLFPSLSGPCVPHWLLNTWFGILSYQRLIITTHLHRCGNSVLVSHIFPHAVAGSENTADVFTKDTAHVLERLQTPQTVTLCPLVPPPNSFIANKFFEWCLENKQPRGKVTNTFLMCGGEQEGKCGIKKPWGTVEERKALALGRTHLCQGLHSLSWTDSGVSACKYKAYISECTKIFAGSVYNSRSKGSLSWIQGSVLFCFYGHQLTSLCYSSVPVSKVVLIQFKIFFLQHSSLMHRWHGRETSLMVCVIPEWFP